MAASPDLTFAAVEARAKEVLHITVGLGLLGLQQFQANRESIEQSLEALGLAPAAAAVRFTAKALDEPVQWLLGRSRRP